MFRRTIAGFVLGPALLVGSFAWSGFLALRTVLDPDRSQEIAEELLDNDEVREQLTANLGRAIEAALPAEAQVSGEVVDGAASTVLADPRVEGLIIDAFGSTHRAFLGEGEAPESLDLTPVMASARSTLEAASPGLADLLPDETQPFVIDLPTEHIPDASPVRRFLERSVPYLAAIAGVGVLIALLATTDRPSILRRAARWAVATTAVYLVIGLGIPWVLRQVAPDQAEVVAALLTALLRTTLVPSIVLAAVGAGLFVASVVWPEGDRRRAPVPVAYPPAASYAHPGTGPQPVAYPPAPTHAHPGTGRQPVAYPPAASYAHPGTGGQPPVPYGDPLPNAPDVHPVAAVPVEPTPPPAPPAPPGPPPGGPPRPAPPRPAPGDVSSTPRNTFRTREGPSGPARPSEEAAGVDGDRWLPPRWVEGHGWVLDPDDPKPPPSNSRWVEGVGYVVPGPPPSG